MIAEPPSSAGAIHETDAELTPSVAVSPVGASGTAATNTALDGDDAGPSPLEFVATTVKVYIVPLLSPATVVDVAVLVAMTPPGEEVTVYIFIEEPPSSTGADHTTLAWVSPPTALTFVGAPGPSLGTTAFEGVDVTLSPIALVANTVNV